MVTFSDKALSSQVISPNELCAHQIFEARVECNPNAVAIVYRNEQVSYQELNLQANRLAHYLSSCGVGPETLVALLAERSIAFAVAMLAIFKAGGAYLPLDPQHPEARQRQVIEQSCCQFVLSTDAFVPTLSQMLSACPAEVCPHSICLEEALLAARKKRICRRLARREISPTSFIPLARRVCRKGQWSSNVVCSITFWPRSRLWN